MKRDRTVEYARWKAKHPEGDKARLRRFRQDHPEKAKAHTDKWRAKNREAFAAYQARYHQENKDRQREMQRRWRASGGREREREATMRRNYGIGFAEYDAMLEAQGGTCAICQDVEPTGARFNVDHDHETGAVRGLLCRKCNVAIGLLGDDPDMVLAAVAYLLRARGC